MSWELLRLPEYITRALTDCGLKQPTPIQLKSIPPALENGSDILGSAPTGSGKTLAFGIPLIARIYLLKCSENQTCDEEVTNEDVTDLTYNKQNQDDLEQNSCTEPSTKKRKKKKKTKIYSDLDVIEELDADTGEVRTMYSLDNISTICRETIPPTKHPISFLSQMKGNRIYGLVLVPTRELAIQVTQHLRALTKHINCIRIETIVGGISVDKQLRLLQRCPDILVATPGRLWYFIQQEEPHVLTLHNVNIIVIDEADRMIEANHFNDLRAIFDWLHTKSSGNNHIANKEDTTVTLDNSKKIINVKRKRKTVQNTNNSCIIDVQRQTLVFSATLTFVHTNAMKPGTGFKNHKLLSRNKSTMTPKIKLAMLREMFGLRKSVKVIDLSSSHPVDQTNSNLSSDCQPVCPDSLSEFRLLCPSQPSKDIRLFWFITFGRHLALSSSEDGYTPIKLSNQRCLIFLNSKSGVRRLAGVLRQLLNSNAFCVSGYPPLQHINVLHADMVQKQRLRALERFQADQNGILLASDVAARGLDLASNDVIGSNGVSWVVHFDVPHTAELYIHRSGRTARANRHGTSLLFISPKEIVHWRRIAISLKRSNPELEDFIVQPTNINLTICEQIVQLAKQIDIQEHRNSRTAANDNWFTKAAKDANILLDDESEDEEFNGKRNSSKKNSDDTKPLKSQLRQLIVVSRGKLVKPTSGQTKYLDSSIQTLSKLKLLKQSCTV